jgi:hypothetical protein
LHELPKEKSVEAKNKRPVLLARAVLVLEGVLPDRLMPMKHMLGVEVIENVAPSE